MSIYAAVTIITFENKEILILKRAINPLDPWSGHISLPGGRIETNESPLEAAIRETHEECNILLNKEDVLSELPITSAGAPNLKVIPYHFNLSRKPFVTLALEEHSDYYWVDIGYLNSKDNHNDMKLSQDFPEQNFPCIMISNTPLWGFTYKVLQNFLKW